MKLQAEVVDKEEDEVFVQVCGLVKLLHRRNHHLVMVGLLCFGVGILGIGHLVQ